MNALKRAAQLEEISRISVITASTADIIESYLPFDVEIYNKVIHEMLQEKIEINHDSLVDHYTDALSVEGYIFPSE